MNDAPDWREYYREMEKSSPLLIHYPLCGGGEECITACPYGESIWAVKPMKVSLFGVREKVRLRPVMVNPGLCRNCQLCVEACPTGALRPVDNPVKHPFLTLAYNTLRLPFKGKYNVKFVFRKEHVERFRKNNGLEV